MEQKITGSMVYYYAVCKRKLWYFANQLTMEGGNSDVEIGKAIDENSYLRDDKHINIDSTVSIDFIKKDGILHEVKKSRKIEPASILQVKYYLWFLKNRGVNVTKGRIDYPLLKITKEVELIEEDEAEIKSILKDIEKIISSPLPPELSKKTYCKRCAYYELCYI